MAAFYFELVSPEKLLFTGNVEAVGVPGSDGDFTVMKDHAPVMTTMRPGIIDVNESGAKSVRLFVRGGFADVSTKGLTILAEQAIPLDQLKADDIAREIKNAEEDLADAANEDARTKAQERLDQMRELKAALGI